MFNIVFLDIKRVFDLVSYESFLFVAERMGILVRMLGYLGEFY